MIPDRAHIQTEHINPRSLRLDEMAIVEGVELMNREDALLMQAVAAQKDAIAQAVAWVAQAFRAGGRLIYTGAGTSGRLGVLDASECPPTFCSDPAMVIGEIAGGDAALRKSIEGVEDDADAGAAIVHMHNINAHDILCGIAAGGTTPFVHGALRAAKQRGARTLFIICTDPAHVTGLDGCVDLFIPIATGPEVVTGSTRLKAGTATKLVLNMLTTLAMVQIGKTYGNLMVDVDALKNRKLTDRAIRIIARLTQLSRDESYALLQSAGGKAKLAIIMHHCHCDPVAAGNLLVAAGGKLRAVIGDVKI